jgi:hypothetical protein
LRKKRAREVMGALRLGQGFAALNCLLEGARGGMYEASKELFRTFVKKVIARERDNLEGTNCASREFKEIWEKLCSYCQTS